MCYTVAQRVRDSQPKREHSSCLTLNDFEHELRVGSREEYRIQLKQLGDLGRRKVMTCVGLGLSIDGDTTKVV